MASAPSRPERVWPFAARVLAWLVPSLAAWYVAAPWYDRAPAWLAQGIVGAYRPGLLLGVEYEGRLLTFVTSVAAPQHAAQNGVVVVEVNALISTYGTALLMALMLASRAPLRRALIGLAILLPFQGWSIAFDLVADLIRSGLVEAAGLAGWRAQLAAYCYQVGSLVFPVLVPVVTWAMLDARFIRQIAAADLQPAQSRLTP